MRTYTSDQLQVLKNPGMREHLKVEIEDGSGTMQEWTDLYGIDFVEAVDISDSLDQTGLEAEVRLHWRRFADNASPYVSGSRLDGMLGEWRDIDVYVKPTPVDVGRDDAGYSWIHIFEGKILKYDIASAPARLLAIDRRVANLIRCFVSSNQEFGDDGGTKDIEHVIQEIWNAYYVPFVERPVLNFPVGTAFQVKSYLQKKQHLLDAALDIATQIGWDLRPKWDESSSSFRMTLYEPDRAASATDYTFTADQVAESGWGRFEATVENVRNHVKVFYSSADDAVDESARTFVERTDATDPVHSDPRGAFGPSIVAGSSIDEFGYQYMELAEGSTSLITSQTAAQNLADAALADLADPTVLAGVRLVQGFWPMQLNDQLEFEPDGERFDSNFSAAVAGYRHHYGPDGTYTELDLIARPGLGNKRWQKREGRPGKAAPARDGIEDVGAPTIASGRLANVLDLDLPAYFDSDLMLIYRSTVSGFTPGPSNVLAAVRGNRYEDGDVDKGETYYYAVAARDRYRNFSGASAEVSATPTGLPLSQMEDAALTFIDVQMTADQTVTDGTVVQLDDEQYDAGGDFDAVTSYNFTAPTAGVYNFEVKITSSGGTGTSWRPYLELYDPIAKTRTIVSRPEDAGVPDGTYRWSGILALNASDAITLEVEVQGESGNVTIDALDADSIPLTFLKINRLLPITGRT